jgi:NF-kappa-B inhibitor-interacting Ras-like protein
LALKKELPKEGLAIVLIVLLQELHSTIEDIYVASIETDRGTREKVRLYDTAGLDGGREQNQLARQYLGLTDGYVLIYDPDRPESLDALVMVKKDIDRNRDKKEVLAIILF